MAVLDEPWEVSKQFIDYLDKNQKFLEGRESFVQIMQHVSFVRKTASNCM